MNRDHSYQKYLIKQNKEVKSVKKIVWRSLDILSGDSISVDS